MLISTAILIGLLMAAILTALILGSLAHNPRIWLGDASKEIKAAVPPLNADEKRLRNLWAIPIFAVTFLMPLAAAFWYEANYQPMNYLEAFLFLWLIWMIFNLVDLIIIDWFVVVWWQPSWSTIPDVVHLMHSVGYSYHFKAFLKGTVMLAVFALIFAGIVVLI
jgi:hypothetical protein